MKPSYFTLPVERFDLNLLPSEARNIGSAAFKTAVVAYFAEQYASKSQQAVVAVDDHDISVLVLPSDSDPLEFVMTMLQSGHIKEAVPYLETLAKASPDNVQVLYNLGIAYSELSQFDEAIIRLKRAVKLDPTHAHAWTGIGVAYQRMGKREQAIEPMQKAVEADPSDGYARRNLGAMLLGAGQYAEALEHLRAARRAIPHDPQALYGLASVLEAVGGEDNEEEADELYLVLIQKFPGAQVAEMAREARTKLAHKSMRSKVGGGLRPDVMMYLAGALETFAKVGPDKSRQITLEVAMKGQEGLDINDPAQKYTLKTLPGQFSGMQLVSIMYVGLKALDPNMDAGIDLSAEYEAAKAMQRA
ncbi:MAG: tetratricopeptide repeat protein [Acidovorax sp.]|uniref:tetratricopeptide repeat protein n=1 Tax=Acidovorax sp. TaxID=1872122 RepID=UPI0022BD3238|nr:tetratricopeptide repeat protein [Acidovorax sp.]MCZ8218847.1 tetratricopeptide repeat protein [Acidovorax sp.]